MPDLLLVFPGMFCTFWGL